MNIVYSMLLLILFKKEYLHCKKILGDYIFIYFVLL